MAQKKGGGGKPSGNNNKLETITGTSGNDELFGTGEDESILGKGGDDRLIGGGGNDILDGGAGDDFIYDGDLDDELIGGKGNDSFYVGGGNNLIDGGSDIDTVYYSGDVRDYTFTSSGSSWSVSYHWTTVDQQAYTETDQLNNVELLNFSFGTDRPYNITILLDGTNNGPLAIYDIDSINENATGFFDVISNDWDFEDDALMLSDITAVVASDPENMTGTSTAIIFNNQNQLAPGSEYLIEWNPGTDFDYLAAGETATVTITYEIMDLAYDPNTVNEATSTSDLTLTVTGSNDGPVIESANLSGDITEAAASAGAQHIGFESLSSDNYWGNITSPYEGFVFSHLYEPSQSFLANINFWETDENTGNVHMNAMTNPAEGDNTLIYAPEGVGLVIESESGASFNFQSAEFAVGGDYATLLWVTGYDADGNVVAEHKQTIDGSQAYPIAFSGFDNVSRVEVSSQQPSDPTPDDPMSYAEGSRTTILIDDIVLEESTSAHSDSGTIEFSDVDLTDSHTVTVTGNETADYRGLMTAVVNDASTGDTQGQITWTFNIADAALDDLAAGQTLTQSYDITVDDANGGTATETFVMTITGSNDAPVIESADLSGDVTEATESAGAQSIGFESLSSDNYWGNITSPYEGFVFSHLYEPSQSFLANINFWETDENAGNVHMNAMTNPAEGDNTLIYAPEGVGLVIESESGASFNFQSAEFAVGGDYATLLWVTGYDADGNVVAEHKQTIDGSQAYPIAFSGFDNVSRVEVSSQQPSDPTPDDPMSYAEGSRTTILIDDIVLEESTSAHSDSGTIEFSDVDLTDSHTVTVAGNETADYRGLMTAVVNDASTGDTQGQITWTFNIADAALDDLAAGQTLTQSYDITVDDANGGTATETVVMTITGSNDAPVIESADLSGDVTEATESAGAQHIGFESLSSDNYWGNITSPYEGFVFSHLYEPSQSFLANINFWETDENAGNVHMNAMTNPAEGDNTLIYAPEGVGLVIESESGASFNFQSAEFAVGGDYATLLWVTGYDADGNVVAEHKQTIDGSQAYPIAFTGFDNVSRVEVSSQQLSDPTPDDPMSYAEGSRTTILIDDIVLEESTSAHSDSGTIEFSDVDLTDSHTVTVAGNETADYRGLMTAVVNDASTGDTQGQITWTFNIADAALDDLAAGQTLTQSYDIKVDDANGGTATETVVMTITGSNDAPDVQVIDVSGTITEPTDAPATGGTLFINFEDLDSPNGQTGAITDYNGFTWEGFSFGETDEGTVLGLESRGYKQVALETNSNNIALTPGGWDFSTNPATGVKAVISRDSTFDFDSLVLASAFADGDPSTGTAPDYDTVTITGYLDGVEQGSLTVQVDKNDPLTIDLNTAEGLTGSFNNIDTVEFTHSYGWQMVMDNLQFSSISAAPESPETGGSLTFTDVDLTDRPTATEATASVTALAQDGTTPLVLTAAQIAAIEAAFSISADPSNTNNGTINWNYVISETEMDFLGEGEVVTAIFTITVTDDEGATATQDVTITLTGTNDGPEANADTGTTDENAAYSIDVLANDTDLDLSNTHTVDTVSVPADQGSVAIINNQVQWDPGTDFDYLAVGETATVVIDYGMSDNNGGSDSSTLTLTVTGSNDGPVANVDTGTTDENTAITVNVLVNDTDVDLSDTHTIDNATVTSGLGSVAIVNNQLEWNPGTDYDYLAFSETATVVIDYDMSDNNSDSDSSTLTLTVTGTNDAPEIQAVNVTGEIGVTTSTSDDIFVGGWNSSAATDTFLNDGSGTLISTDQPLTLLSVRGMDTGDINGDGYLDIAAGTQGQYTKILFNNGDGTFTEGLSIGGTSTTFDVAIGDYNSDGKLDIYNANSFVADELWLQNEDGTFSNSVLPLGTTQSRAVESADVNDDGHLDIVVANSNAADISNTKLANEVLLGDGLGGFTAFSSFGPDHSYSLDLGDVNNDGHIDAVVGTWYDDNRVYLNDGDGNFTDTGQALGMAALDSYSVIELADLNNDGFLDAVISNNRDRDEVWLNDADNTGNFSFHQYLGASSDNSYGLALSDFDHDGDLDAFINTNSSTTIGDYIWVNDGAGNFDASPVVVGSYSSDALFVIAGDFDGSTSNTSTEANGSLTFTDLDLTDRPTAAEETKTITALAQDGTTSLPLTAAQTAAIEGAFSISADAVNTNNGTINWNYAISQADMAFLGEGEVVTAIFSITVTDDEGANAEQDVTITLTGSNDAPVAGDTSITATEDGASVIGSFYATDTDTTDSHSFAVTSTPAEGSVVNNNDGTFTFDPGTDFQDLAEGQTRDVSFSYTAIDGSGADNATSEAKTVTVTVTGTNDAPVVKISNPSENFTGSVTESDSADPALNAVTLTTAAAIAFSDLDVTDTNHSVSVYSVAVSSGNAGSLNNATLLGFMSANTTGAPNDGIDGSIKWSFAAAGNLFDYLDEGETLELTYTLELSDEVDSPQTEVTITVTGAGDIPVLTNSVEAQSGFVGDSFTVTLPTDLFTDHDEGGSVSYTAALDDGSPLPGWLSLNETTYELSGTPGATDSGLYNINVTATEDDGQQSNYTFTLTVLDGSAITGTIGNDNLTGTINGDFIQGLAGNDTLKGSTGADLINGGEGSDFLYGEAGDDVLTGGNDTDYDYLYGGDGNDILTAGEGGSYLRGDKGDDVLTGGSGDDNIDASTDYGYTETIDAGAGNDRVYDVGYHGNDMVDLGSGDDYVRLRVAGNSTYQGTPTLTLGTGQDEVELNYSYFNQYAFATITDFEAGAGGDIINLDLFLNNILSGWDGSVNPFDASAGFFQLIQSGTDTLLQIDTNGDGDNYVTAVVFENVDVSSFTADNFSPAYPPDGSVPNGETIEGTAAGETLYGTIGADTIDALEGNDWVYGGSASDTIDGGQGIDYLYGEAGDDILTGGNDTYYDYLYGGDGNDTLTGGEGGSQLHGGYGNDTLTGGSGNDTIYADTDYGGYTETIVAGAGNDRVYDVGYYGSDSVDLGSGDDYVRIRVQGNSTYQGTPTLTLGTGQDEVDFLYSNFSQYAFVTITDFETGAGGDIINLDYTLNNHLSGWDGSVNPFNAAAGFLQLIQSGTDTLLQIDTNGSGDSYVTAVVFENVEVSSFTSDNFSPAWLLNGNVPTGETIEGTAAGETLYGTIGADTIDALEGNDWIYGGFSSDTIDGGEGSDRLYGQEGDDILTGGNDTDLDYLNGGDGNDTLTAGEGGSELRGGYGDDTFTGGSGTDYIYADTDSGYTETIDAGAGNDRVYDVGYYGSDSVDLGSGDDYVMIRVQGNYTYQGTPTLTLGAGQDEVDLYASSFNQYAFATITDFEAGAGGDIINLNDTLNSRLTGWDGASSPFASGFMKLIQEGSHTLLQIDTNGGGDSYVTAVVFENVDVNSFTADNFSPAFPPDGSGIFGTTFTGTSGNDVYDGTIGDDSITGGAGEDTLSGGNGNDSIDGGMDNDTINGSFGNDTLAGGEGDDQLSGGDGKDTFVFSQPSTLYPHGYVDTDTINDFNIADGDTINLTSLLSSLSGLSETGASLDPVLDFSLDGSTTVIDVVGVDANVDGFADQTIRLENVDLVTDSLGNSLSDEQIIDALFAGNNLDIFS